MILNPKKLFSMPTPSFTDFHVQPRITVFTHAKLFTCNSGSQHSFTLFAERYAFFLYVCNSNDMNPILHVVFGFRFFEKQIGDSIFFFINIFLWFYGISR